MPHRPFRPLTWLLLVGVAAAVVVPVFARSDPSPAAGQPSGPITEEQVLRGRQLVISRDCGACHGGGTNPAAEGWLAGTTGEPGEFEIGGYSAVPANLTPDSATGIGRYTDRQLFNSMRYGLRPAGTPDLEITSARPGMGNHPARPSYLAPLMPWASLRHSSDQELWDIIAYLRHVRPVRHELPPAVLPADGWASEYAVERVGSYPAAAFPTATEVMPEASRLDQVRHGRALVIAIGCGDCHGGRANPASSHWMKGVLPEAQRVNIGPYEIPFPIGPFTTYPRNLTPDNVTGLGRFSERQLFNALRYGLRPGETADVEITATTPGQGNFPLSPKYLAIPMPWPAWRHLADEELWAIAAYLKHGLKPVRNLVEDSEGPPDFWASAYTPEEIGTRPPPAFPTARERAP